MPCRPVRSITARASCWTKPAGIAKSRKREVNAAITRQRATHIVIAHHTETIASAGRVIHLEHLRFTIHGADIVSAMRLVKPRLGRHFLSIKGEAKCVT